MVITLQPDLQAALEDYARQRGVASEEAVALALRERLLVPARRLEPQDDWERHLLTAASDCGTALSNEALSSEGLYE
jgi:hypothetical protein